MSTARVDRIISEVLLEQSLTNFYCKDDSCKGWERNVVTQPNAVKNIVKSGAERISAGLGVGKEISDSKLASMIDHTLLKAEATPEEVIQLCAEAKEYSFASVCVNPGYVALSHSLLKDTVVKVCTVIGFPLGATSTASKRFEAEDALKNGAQELDMVINVGRVKAGDWDYVFNDIQQVVLSAKKERAIVKVILETALLTDEEIVKSCLICKQAGADFVKTSTGFSKAGATVGNIALMRFVVGSTMGVKASGGIRTKEDAEAMIAGGADRVGASASVKIVLGEKTESKGY